MMMGPGTGWRDKQRREIRPPPPPPSSSWSCLVLISSAMSRLLFPACPGIHLVPSVVHYFLQKPPESLQMSPAVWMPLASLRTPLAPRHQGGTYSRGFKMETTPTNMKRPFSLTFSSLLDESSFTSTTSTHTSHQCAQNMDRRGLHLSVSNALIHLCVHGFGKVCNKIKLARSVLEGPCSHTLV